MISSEVERTLVKSPPELWTELSNPDALARHLGEFGEIRITRVEPEHEVEWQAGDTAGTVRIKPSGWGTKVTLTATRELTAPEQPVEVQPVSQPAPLPEPAPPSEPAPEHASVLEPEPERVPERRLRFFRRWFGGARTRSLAQEPREIVREPEPPDPFKAIREALTPETVAVADPFSAPRVALSMPADVSVIAQPAGPATNVSADLEAAEEVASEEVTAVLTSVLDRLGAAHHRPFSRA